MRSAGIIPSLPAQWEFLIGGIACQSGQDTSAQITGSLIHFSLSKIPTVVDFSPEFSHCRPSYLSSHDFFFLSRITCLNPAANKGEWPFLNVGITFSSGQKISMHTVGTKVRFLFSNFQHIINFHLVLH